MRPVFIGAIEPLNYYYSIKQTNAAGIFSWRLLWQVGVGDKFCCRTWKLTHSFVENVQVQKKRVWSVLEKLRSNFQHLTSNIKDYITNLIHQLSNIMPFFIFSLALRIYFLLQSDSYWLWYSWLFATRFQKIAWLDP